MQVDQFLSYNTSSTPELFVIGNGTLLNASAPWSSNDTTTWTSLNQTTEWGSNLTKPTLAPSMYSSEAEQVANMVVVFVLGCGGLAGQLAVAAAVLHSPELRHDPHFLIVLGQCFNDMLILLLVVVGVLALFATDGPTPAICELGATLTTCLIFGQPYHIALLSVERYFFFVYPLKYVHMFTERRVIVVMVVIYAATLVYTTTLEGLIGREFHTSVLSCQLPKDNIRNLINFVLVYLLPAFVVAGSLIGISRLKKRASVGPGQPVTMPRGAAMTTLSIRPLSTLHQQQQDTEEHAINQPAPAESTASANDSSGAFIQLSRQAAKSVRMVLLISSAFWGTTVPSSLISTAILSSELPWEYLDAFVYQGPSQILRMCAYLVSLVSSVVNPMIYFWSRKHLRKAFLQMIHDFRLSLGHTGLHPPQLIDN